MFKLASIPLAAITLVLLCGCFRKPSLQVTDEYVSVVKPGQIFGIQEVRIKKFDSLYNYPLDEEVVSSYTIANRSNKKQIKGSDAAKVYFAKKNKSFQWKYYPDPVMGHYKYLDTIGLKSNTWYRISSEKSDVVLFLHYRKKGDYQVFKRYEPAVNW